ncbi:MAG: V-type ATP synthase subunit I [Candidatus Woesearchaeota archaeon]|jgi:V/A-type H+-transporting ATPase subunit I|nr:V-type ATP synthase subunit I [Candidatus Woesearchaeota archaeon]|tara:strand:+ start:186 stop:2144 length:1959 start_codon:yes stop_codon:yes gene_type:complete
MKKVVIFALNNHRDTILSKIQKLGLMQPVDLKKSEVKELNKPLDNSNLRKISDSLLRISRLVNILKIPPKKPSFVQSILGLDLLDKKPVQHQNYTKVLQESESFLNKHEKELINLEDDHSKLLEREEELGGFHVIVELFGQHNIPLELLASTEKISIVTGRVSNEHKQKLEQELNEKLNSEVHIITKEQDKKESIITVVSLKEKLPDLNFLMKKYNVSQFTIPEWGIKKDPKNYVETELKSVELKKEEIMGKISKYASNTFEGAVILREELEILKHRYETIHSMLDSEKFFVLQGWILANKLKHFETELKTSVNESIIIKVEDPKKDDNPPVELSNKKHFKPFEMLTELYALPKYKDLDPTFIVGPLFLIFAAFMLTDAVYGFFLVILGILILKKFAKYSESMKQIAVIILGMGLLTVMFGILTGSYFGDFPKYIWGMEPKDLAIWKDPLEDPLYFLIIAIGTAVIYLNIGFILGVIEDFRKRDFKTMFKERLVWFMLQAGIALLILKANPILFSLLGKDIGLATLIITISVLSIVITSGPLGLLSITGLMGDMISFSRLFALSLSTAGIALAVNLLANLVKDTPFVGIILAAIIFLIGHAFGFVMNSIGSFVHSLRLQFVEFFGRFYEGGGDKFTPLKEDRYYTEVKEDDN